MICLENSIFKMIIDFRHLTHHEFNQMHLNRELIFTILIYMFLVKSDNAVIRSVENKKENVRCFQCSYGDLTKQSQDHGKRFFKTYICSNLINNLYIYI